MVEYLIIEIVYAWIAIAFGIMAFGFIKKAGVVVLMGGLVFMALGTFVDGSTTSRAVATTTTTGNITGDIGTISETMEYDSVNTDWPVMLRILIVMSGIGLIAVGLLRYGFSI